MKKDPIPLKLSTQLFSDLNSKNIRYCHWKSNIRLADALSGETDLDILVYLKDKELFINTIKDLGFISIQSAPECTHQWMENALGCDPETGKLLHLHIHYKLILGEMYIKNHHLPIETFIFQNCRYVSGVCVPAAELELLLLIIRSHMKLTTFAILRRLMIMRKLLYPIDILDEINYLILDSQPDRFDEMVRKSGLPLSNSFMNRTFDLFSRKKVTQFDTIKIRKKIFQALKRYRILTAFYSKFIFYWRQIRRSSIITTFFSGSSCRLPVKGKMVALVGADGSGKSTIAEDLSKWLGWRLRISKIYFGGPKNGICSKLMFLEWVLLQFIRRIHIKIIQNLLKFFRHWSGIYRLYLAARSRRRLYLKAERKIAKGDIIVFDRYPLPEFKPMPIGIDGIEIRKVYGNCGSKIADFEEKAFSYIGQPDLAIFLRVSLSKLRTRKPDVPPFEQHKLTVDCLQKLEERNGLVIIDGEQNYNKVLLDTKKAIWKGIFRENENIFV
jgi:thymidylate kinase